MKKSDIDVKIEKEREISEIFLQGNGYARTNDLVEKGIHQRDIKTALQDGLLTKIKNGLFRYTEIPLISHQGFVTIFRLSRSPRPQTGVWKEDQ